jgi:hypothetical protein
VSGKPENMSGKPGKVSGKVSGKPGNVEMCQESQNSVSSSPVPLNWWTEFSSWQDLRALHRTGSKLSIHRIVENLNRDLEAIGSVNAYIGTIDENGSIDVMVFLFSPKIMYNILYKIDEVGSSGAVVV